MIPEEISEQADEECFLLRAKSQKLQQRITTLEEMSERREKQMKRLLKRLDGAMQMLEALEDMCGQQRKVISAQQLAISALKEEGAVDDDDDEEEEEEEEEDTQGEDVSEEKLMALFQQAEQMERALKQIEALGKAGLLNDGPGGPGQGDGDASVDAILSRLHALEEEKANFERMVAQSKWQPDTLARPNDANCFSQANTVMNNLYSQLGCTFRGKILFVAIAAIASIISIQSRHVF